MGRAFRHCLGVLGAGLLVAVSAGCGGGGAAKSETSLELTKLTVAAVPVGDEAGLYIASNLGLFKAAGLSVTIAPILSSATAMAGQNDGTYDITAGNSVSYVQAQASHRSNLEVVAEGSLMQPGNQALYTLSGSNITTVGQLAGKRIGVNVLNDLGTLLISSVLQSHGIPAQDVHFVAIKQGFQAMGIALQEHVIDAAWLPEPFGSLDQVIYGLHQLVDLDQGATVNFPVGWYVVTKTWAQRHPRTLEAFLNALRAGQQIADTDRSIAEQAMEQLPAPYTVPELIASIMSLERYPLNIAPHIDPFDVQRVTDEMREFGMLRGPFKVETMLAP